jgi:NAD(P)-dependent dehydrogenase (short-subunit alcohol dehydrogenase family)
MNGVVFVTGSSRGIGAATAKLAAQRGCAVAINYVAEEERANQVAGDIRGKGGRTIVMQGDTANEKDVVRMFETIDRELGPLAALVNNAGITGRSGRLTDYSADDIRRILDVSARARR